MAAPPCHGGGVTWSDPRSRRDRHQVISPLEPRGVAAGDDVAPPPVGDVWRLRFATNDAVLATGTIGGTEYPQWEYEVTAGGRVRYLVDQARRTVYLVSASSRHPKDTDA
jgi:hypothetical protein